MPGIAGVGGHRVGSWSGIAGYGVQVTTHIEFGCSTGCRAQCAMRIAGVVASCSLLVQLDPFDARTGANLDPATRSNRQRRSHRGQQRLQQQCQQQKAGKQSSVAYGIQHRGASLPRLLIGNAGILLLRRALTGKLRGKLHTIGKLQENLMLADFSGRNPEKLRSNF